MWAREKDGVCCVLYREELQARVCARRQYSSGRTNRAWSRRTHLSDQYDRDLVFHHYGELLKLDCDVFVYTLSGHDGTSDVPG